MTNRKSSHPHISQANLFLFELILAAAFLSLSSVVCIRLYLAAHTLSSRSAARTHAITEAQNAADLWLSGTELPDAVYYDKDWAALNWYYSEDATSPEADFGSLDGGDSDAVDEDLSGGFASAAYSMDLAASGGESAGDSFQTLRITVCSLSGGSQTVQLYSLEVERYVP